MKTHNGLELAMLDWMKFSKDKNTSLEYEHKRGWIACYEAKRFFYDDGGYHPTFQEAIVACIKKARGEV
jgi:hypothetical protein